MNKKELESSFFKGSLHFHPSAILEEKDVQILARTSKVLRYLPDEELYPSLLLSLLQLPRQFKKIRSVGHLGRLICAFHFYKKKIVKAIDQAPQKRHLYVKLLKTRLKFPFGSKSVLGVCVTLNLLKHREAFEEQHILEAIRRILPGVTLLRGSFLENREKESQILSVYLEVEREENPEISLDEIYCLEKALPFEFKGCIQQLVPMTFMRRNEEDVYRNILALRDQLKSVHDIPQATITFEEQTQLDLFFTVVLVRVAEGTEESVQALFEKIHPHILFILDRVYKVGNLLNNYEKEAVVFRVQIPKSRFFRKDRSVNLYKARQYVVSMLIEAVGAIRDFNGGLILKQNEKLEAFLSLMPTLYDEFFLENFFYSITPIAMQSILPAPLLKEWFLTASELLDRDIPPGESSVVTARNTEEATIVAVCAEEPSFKKGLLKAIHQLEIPSLELAFSETNVHGKFCFSLLYRFSLQGKQEDLCRLIRHHMQDWSKGVNREQTLQIAIHGTEPSLDPRVPKEDQSHLIIKMLFEGLTRIGPDGEPQFAIAKSYTASSDYRTYTFHLRAAKWSDGTPVTAQDFEYTWKQALAQGNRSLFSYSLNLLKNARKAREGMVPIEEVGVKAVDEKTLIVHLEYPAPYFPHVAAHWTYSAINSTLDQRSPDWAQQVGSHFVCNGPFRLVQWRDHRSLTLEKNPFYWDKAAVKLNQISIAMYRRDRIDKEMILSGKFDIYGKPLIHVTDDILREPISQMQHIVHPLSNLYILCFNTTVFPFSNRKIRQALCYAVDRSEMNQIVGKDYAGPGDSLLPKDLSLHTTPPFPQRNLEKARELFREGLGEIGFVKSDLPRMALSFFNKGNRWTLFHTLCEQWREAFDVTIHLAPYEWETHFQNLVTGQFQMGSIELTANWADPLHLLEYVEDKTHPLNVTRWEHETYQKLLHQAKEMVSLERRNDYLRQAEALLAEEIPAIPLFQVACNYLQHAALKDVYNSPFSKIDFKWAHREGS